MHRPVAGAGQLRHQGALPDDREVRLGLGVEELVLHADHRRPGAPQHPPSYDVLRLGGRRLVEHGRGRSPPVDQERVTLLVAQTDPADVARLRIEGRPQVEPAEDETLVGSIELGDPLRRLEHHGVALDQATLVTEPPAAVSFARQLARVAR